MAMLRILGEFPAVRTADPHVRDEDVAHMVSEVLKRAEPRGVGRDGVALMPQ
jgi:hypothetical protein